jgi:hypothetical protein
VPTDTFSVTASADDGQVEREGVTGAWPPAGAFSTFDNTTNLVIRKVQFTGTFNTCVVTGIRFDTSALPNDAVVSAATLRLQTIAKGAGAGRSVQVGYYDPANWPLGDADWSGADNPGSDGGTFPFADFAASTQEDLALSNPTSVSLTGYTGLRLSVSGGAPTPDEDHRLEFASLDHLTVTEPQLLVTYTSASEGGVLVQPPIRRVF